ncbi:unnamed protein product [Arabidopsis lyrata]|uniref:F-box domain-containing protein n=1 Tax=Arabidopsis lyrata subsp. lyrata TaxID=81972 RepID=D7L6D5_ARALL|nr:hypothetical protein ARALYDRAFT_899868 [Arabidopsis lyrata subsp. lyrata]CAH8262812.1 unnamed protein product [Arabidopsis lyrata]
MKTQQQRDEDNDDGSITTVGNSNTESIPLDLTIEILKRLPAESIFRFRCVSKQWCSITCSRHFIDSFYVFVSVSTTFTRLLEKKSSTSFVIVSFDVEFERLLLIEAPKEEVKLDYRLKLINYKGKLALFTVNNDYSYILCVLDDIKKQIWLTKSTGVLCPSFCDLSSWNFLVKTCDTDAEEICFVSPSNASELFFYDSKKNNVRRRVTVEGITEEFRRRCFFRSCDHVDNIVSF